MSYVLIIGAKSDIAKEIARVYAKNGYDLYLAGRDINSLNGLANDIKIRSDVDVKLKELDLLDFDSHKFFYDALEEGPLGVIIVAGYMAEQKECEKDWDKTINTINVNYTGATSILNIVANDFEVQKRGFIVGVSSVAGDRGRSSNYIYGSSKAGLSTYLEGLQHRLFKSNVHVLIVKPGFVATKMTADMNLPGLLTAKPDEVSSAIYMGIEKRKNVIYVKRIWSLIMLVIRNIPNFIFKRMPL